ncbi:Molybdate-anion transporter [Chamberlinius hualienensis]
MDISVLTYCIFGIVVSICSILQFRVNFKGKSTETDNGGVAVTNPHFKAFQNQFFLPYFLSLFSDWLQGPYVYKLYSSYGFQESQIAFLYVIGFASSALFGTFAGILADRYGRKRSSLIFCLIYMFCCLTKISSDFYWLALGRIMGGVATSLLFSTFESWYIYEHCQKHQYPVDWMSLTFSKATLCNGFLAIVAGILANIFAETFAFGPLAPFLMAVPVLFISMILIAVKWEENYGLKDTTNTVSCVSGLVLIFKDKSILILGIIQFLFESVMYMFVFIWTPILDTDGRTPLGMVFACFMVSMMIGSSICQLATPTVYSSESVLKVTLLIGFISILTCFGSTYSSTTNLPLSFGAFLVLEVSVGMYFPTISFLRGQIVPESHRATIMNWFRLPMNAITCGGLLWLHDKNKAGNNQIFAICAVLLLIACIASFGLKRTKPTINVESANLINYETA